MIRFAQKSDIKNIMKFIDTCWKKGHILGTDRVFFEYEHLLDEGVTYVISVNNDNANDINAILGYIPYGKSNRDVMTVMWKANHTAHSSLGLELFQYLKENGDVRIMASPGTNPKLKGVYCYLGYLFGKLTQWYRLSQRKEYCVADISNDEIPNVHGCVTYTKLNTWDSMAAQFDFEGYNRNAKPYKEQWYIKKRYFNHSIFTYEVFGVRKNGVPECTDDKYPLVVIFRVINVNGTSVLRLIDCIGDFSILALISNLLDDVLQKYDAEYVDCYEVGLPDFWMSGAGFKKVEGSGNIIPNYFEPFVRENIDIYYFSNDPDIVLFKGDGDQDRPNRRN